MYHLDDDFVVILDVFAKTSPQAQKQSISRCQKRLAEYLALKAASEGE